MMGVFSMDCGDSFMGVLSSKPIRSHTLNKCSFLYVNQTSIECLFFLKKNRKELPREL